jgi:hypothetical protein
VENFRSIWLSLLTILNTPQSVVQDVQLACLKRFDVARSQRLRVVVTLASLGETVAEIATMLTEAIAST